jgi:hypothetical protein
MEGMTLGDVFWWALLGLVLVWGWDYLKQFRR